MGVIKLDGKFKPTARLLNPNADLSDIPTLSPWSRFTKPFWLMIIGISLFGTLVLWAWVLRHYLRQYCQRLAENQSKLNRFIRWLNAKLRQTQHRYKQTFIGRLWLQIINLITGLAKIMPWLKSAIAYYLPWRVLNRWLATLQLNWQARSKRPRKPTKKSAVQLSQDSAIDLDQEGLKGANKYRQLSLSDPTTKRKLARRLRRSRLRGRLRR
jgi:hypothetical protein